MNLELVEKIANTILYEGYMLYPYRPSAVKNRQRFNFGVLYPREYCDAQSGPDAWRMQTECLVQGTSATTIDVQVRFLQLSERENWHEGHERDVCVTSCRLNSIGGQPLATAFVFPAGPDAQGNRQETVAGELEMTAQPAGDGLFKLTLCVSNSTGLRGIDGTNRDEVLLRSLISVHTILHVSDGEFVSLLDPPDQFQEEIAKCQNLGTWPVLVGEDGQRDTMLSAPIILYDYPRIAPESPGDLFDGTEIDEILALRILTMTDAEKAEVRNSDERARLILERAENLAPEHFQKLHGVLRGLRAVSGEGR